MTVQVLTSMTSLDSMLRARSIAIVGASERPGSVGDQTVRQLVSGGFTGVVYPVNPRYAEVHGIGAFPSLDAIGSAVDLVVLAVANDALEAEMERAVEVGARSVAIFASCHGKARAGGPLSERLRALADGARIPICGGNGMGFLNLEEGIRVCGFYQPDDMMAGGVTFLSHSGSLFSAMLHNRRGIRFNVVVSTGLEINATMGDYMAWALGLDSTRVVSLFLETIRDPAGFRRALTQAEERDIPVVALKVGASSRGREAVATHSEGIAGDDAVYEALFEAHGVHRVWTMDEMADTVELFSAGRRVTTGGLGAVHDSGGERALLIDTADRTGVTLPQLGAAAIERIAAVLDPGLEPANPVDAWGTGRDAEDVFVECLDALAQDPAIGVLAFCFDLTAEEKPDYAYSSAAFTVAERTEKPLAVLANLSTTVDPVQAGRLREGGVPVLEGTETGLLAIRHLIDHGSRRRTGDSSARLTRVADPISGVEGEASALGVLAGYGIPVPAFEVVSDEDSLLGAARRIGYPVVLKTASRIDHKTEAGGVITGIGDEERLREAFVAVTARLGPEVMVAEQVSPGVEVALGMVLDEQFGPVVIISAGGRLIELLGDRVALLPPVEEPAALDALDRLRIRPLLGGFRDGRPVQMDRLVDVIIRFSELATDAAGRIGAIDVNPVIAGPERSVAVDALMTPA
jgi:acyl-CoA synthetase (NDP forming)